MNAKLYKAVIRKLGDKSLLEDVANHGADAGFPGFTYYNDTVPFFKRHRAEIVEMVKEYADEMGESPIEFVKSFNCLKDGDFEEEIARCLYGRMTGEYDYIIANALAWFALEEAARYDR